MDKTEWSGPVGAAWADEWRRTDRSFSALTPTLLARIADRPGSRVLDVGCGAGELSLAVAAARPDAVVQGVDISEDLVTAARRRADGAPNVAFRVADAGEGDPAGFAPDLLVSRHGVMFFPDPTAAFAALAQTAAPGARLVFSCFRAPAENAWASDLIALVPPDPAAAPPSPNAPGPFAFADPSHVGAILAAAGWEDVGFEPVDFAYLAGEGVDPVAEAVALFRRIGPAAARLRALDAAERGPFEAKVAELAQRRRTGDRVSFPAAAWIVTARAAPRP